MRTTRALAIGAALAAVAVAGCGRSSPGTMTAHGTIQAFADPLNGQTVQDTYPDISAGGQVTVTNASGKVIGSGTLAYDPKATRQAEVTFAATVPGTPPSMYGEWLEVLTFTVHVPAGLARYGIETGHDRGTVWFTAAQMRKGPALSLGSMGG